MDSVTVERHQDHEPSIQTWLVLDTEFVSSRGGNQPFQLAFIAYRLEAEKLVKTNEFSVYVLLKKGVKLNYYAKKYTGITETKLEKYGILLEDAALQLLQFLLAFPFESTVLVGWDPTNDQRMLQMLLAQDDAWSEIAHLFSWVDLSAFYLYQSENGSWCTPSLQDVCRQEGIPDVEYHDATADALATSALLAKLLTRHGASKVLQKKRPARKARYRKQRNGNGNGVDKEVIPPEARRTKRPL